jgi:FtsP/CotA-like multicopper oxidase with cupredoxin domain
VLRLRAAAGSWRPEGAAGPALQVESMGEEDGPLQAPAPLIRVPAGTEVVVSVRNELDAALKVYGLCARDGSPCLPLDVAAAGTAAVTFSSGRPGTYHYWATSTGMPLSFRGATDTQMSGAFVVDPRGGVPRPDRVLVITEWTSLTRGQLRELAGAPDPGVAFLALNPRLTFLINGLSWPSTERLSYTRGEEVRWRVINLSSQSHPMHLHGFHFSVNSLGDGLRDDASPDGSAPQVVTQLLASGRTMMMTWRPERAGNWLFHCHIVDHVAPERRLSDDGPDHDHHANDASAGMAGMILGVTVTDPGGRAAAAPVRLAARRLTLAMHAQPKRFGEAPAYGFALVEDAESMPPATVAVPGPVLVLEQGVPVEITLINRLPEATAIHWHGMELESYYDGVHGWSGSGSRVTPMIEPGRRFTVRFTPPRAGTFIYHTHLHDHQLASGLYGAMLVTAAGQARDQETDHVVVIGRDGPGRGAPAVLNGLRTSLLTWKPGARHRLRLINITPGDIFAASLVTADGPVQWRIVAKDGAAVPAGSDAPRRAVQTIAVGETYDVEFDAPPGRSGLWLNVQSTGGRWEVQARIAIQ